MWGINAASQIYRFNHETNAFDRVTGILTAIGVAGPDAVWGINGLTQIFRFNRATQLFDLIPGELTDIAVGIGAVWGLNSNHSWPTAPVKLVFRYNSASNRFDRIEGDLAQIWINDAPHNIRGFNAKGIACRFDSSTGNFVQASEGFSWMAMKNGFEWGIDYAFNVFRLDNGNFVKVPGALHKIATDDQGFAWGLG